MTRVEDAVSIFSEGFSCSQAIFATFAVEFGLDRDVALKTACGFGGGMARIGETCGAVTGAFMVIGLKYGKIHCDDKEAKEKTYELVNEFISRFKHRNETILCKELLGYDLSTTEGREAVKDKGLTTSLCPEFVKDAAEILEEIL